MMRILSRSGVFVVADETNSYEYKPTITLEEDNKWVYEVPKGRAIKVLWPFSGYLPWDIPYKMLWMKRNPKEQAKSQLKFSGPNQMQSRGLRRIALKSRVKNIAGFNRRVPGVLREMGADVLEVQFEQLVSIMNVEKIEKFLDRTLDTTPITTRKGLKKRGNILPVGQLELAR